MPTSVLLAVLAAAGLLALAPALVRRYDATERLVAERAQSSARVINRTRRRRTVPLPGRPLHLPSLAGFTLVGFTQDQEQSTDQRVRPTVGRSVWLQLDRVVPSADAPSIPRVVEPSPPAGSAPISVRRVPSANADGRAGARPSAARKAQPAPRKAQPAPSRTAQPAAARATQPAVRKAQPAARTGQPARRVQPKSRDLGSNGRKARPTSRRPARAAQSPAVYRRRRVLAGLILLNVIELIGVTTVSAGFWTGFAVTLFLLVGYVVHLRNSSIVDARTRRLEARRAARIAVEQAEIREENERRLAARREALRRAAAARATAQRDAQRLSQRYVDYDPERGARVRGRPYETGKNYDDHAAGF